MAISFNLIPNDVKQPLFYAEVSNSKAAKGATVRPTLLVGQALGSEFTAYYPVRIFSLSQAYTLFRPGSQLGRMCKAYFDNDAYAPEVWCLPLADNGTTKATKTLTITGSSTAAGTLNLYIAGQKLAISVTSGMSATSIGAAIEAALGADEATAAALGSTYPVTAVNTSGEVAFTARNAGTLGNQIDLRVNYLGAAGSETLPTGIAITELTGVTKVYLSGGSSDPSLTTPLANLGDRRYSYVAQPYTDSTSLASFKTAWADSATGRWGPTQRTYGHVFAARVDTAAALAALSTQNDPHMSIFGIEGCPNPPWEIAGAFAGRAAGSLRTDPARPLNTLELAGILAPAPADQFTWTEREQILANGVTTPLISSSNSVCIQRAITTYTKNAMGGADASYRDVTTPATLDYLLTELENLVSSKFARMKLVSDGSQFGPGQAVVTPSMIKAEIIAAYRGWERLALVEGTETFAKLLVVERNEADPNRVDVLFPPDLANSLMIFAALAEFRLQYTAGEIAA